MFEYILKFAIAEEKPQTSFVTELPIVLSSRSDTTFRCFCLKICTDEFYWSCTILLFNVWVGLSSAQLRYVVKGCIYVLGVLVFNSALSFRSTSSASWLSYVSVPKRILFLAPSVLYFYGLNLNVLFPLWTRSRCSVTLWTRSKCSIFSVDQI